MSKNSTNYVRRKNRGVYYRSRSWPKAVASHSKFAPRNTHALSRYIPGEIGMHHLQRKNTILPSGYTIKESWAALRKSWLGFKIAHSKGDTALKKHYASFIIKVQKEMGIGLTTFDLGLFNGLDMTTPESSATEDAYEQGDFESDANNQEVQESLPDYEGIIDEIPVDSAYPHAREEIFATYKDRSQRSCEYERADELPTVHIEKERVYPDSSCLNDSVHANKMLREERKRKLQSCLYKSKAENTNSKDSS